MLLKDIKLSVGFLIVSLYSLSFSTSFAAAINGIWQSEGYSNILVINDSDLLAFELSTVSCIKTGSTPISLVNQEFTSEISDHGQELTLLYKYSMDKYAYQRINHLPQLCQNGGTQATTDPILNFDILWHSFNENYAFFDLRGVNWDAMYATYRPQVSSTTSTQELFNILKIMLAPLNDGHVTLSIEQNGLTVAADDDRILGYIERIIDEYILLSPNMSLPIYFKKQMKRYHSIISDYYLRSNIKFDSSKLVSWGKIENRIGYLSIDEMEGFSATGDSIIDLQVLSQTMDQVMADLRDMDSIVIDVRLNGGGYDTAADQIASRFTAKQRSVMIKKAVSQQGFSDKIVFKTAPKGQTIFTKPVFVLFSEESASAAETFLLRMKVLPNVTLIGEHSNGIFSDKFERRLANSMTFTLSNEVTTDMDGINYEKIGVQPDIAIDFLMKSDRDNGIDSAIEKAISLTP